MAAVAPARRSLAGRTGRFRLIAVDLDGTLLRSNGTASARTRRALALIEPADAQLVIVTGRPWRWFQEVRDLVTDEDALVVCLNGAATLRVSTGEMVTSCTVPYEQAARLVARLRGHRPDVRFAAESTAGFGHEEGYRQRGHSFARPVERVETLLRQGNVLKLLAQHPTIDAEKLTKAVLADDPDGVSVTFSSPSVVEIGGAQATKATGLARLAATIGVDRGEVLAFGDMPNDVAMLVWAGHGVAVANAHAEALAAADEVTASNDDDGVALVLEREFGQPGARL